MTIIPAGWRARIGELSNGSEAVRGTSPVLAGVLGALLLLDGAVLLTWSGPTKHHGFSYSDMSGESVQLDTSGLSPETVTTADPGSLGMPMARIPRGSTATTMKRTPSSTVRSAT